MPFGFIPDLAFDFAGIPRISKKRDDALTLVVDPEHGSDTTVAWCLSKRERPDDVVADLRCREETTVANIGYLALKNQPAKPNSIEKAIFDWATAQKLDGVVWTALKGNFEEKTSQRFSIERAIAHLKTLSVDGKVKAAEYVWKAPEFVRTPLRLALETEPWFSEPASERQKAE